MVEVRLTGRGRRRVLGGHPWVYRDDVADATGVPAGALVHVASPDRRSMGWALYSDASKIAVRMVTRSETQPNRAFWVAVIQRALAIRASAGMLQPAGAERLLAGDADSLPGLVIDRYRDRLVIQSGCQGSDAMRDFLLELLLAELEARGLAITAILDRSDATVRRHEKLEPRVEWLRGSSRDQVVLIDEDGLAFEVDLLGGHKTGFYLDQRDNRKRAAALCRDYARHGFARVAEPRVLDVFSYDGLFGLRCALAGAGQVLCLDQAQAAGERLAEHAARAGVAGQIAFERVDAMGDLGRRVSAGEAWDVVILDPPAFARSRREVEGAKRGYGELFRRGFQLTRQGGFVVAASCSFNMGYMDFNDILVKAARDAGVTATLLGIDGPSPDHPRRLDLPESDYLKCAFVRVDPAL